MCFVIIFSTNSTKIHLSLDFSSQAASHQAAATPKWPGRSSRKLHSNDQDQSDTTINTHRHRLSFREAILGPCFRIAEKTGWQQKLIAGHSEIYLVPQKPLLWALVFFWSSSLCQIANKSCPWDAVFLIVNICLKTSRSDPMLIYVMGWALQYSMTLRTWAVMKVNQ